MVFPLLGWLGSALGLGTGIGSLFTKGAASTALSAVGGLKTAYDQATLDVPPNLTPYEQVLYRAKAGLPPLIRGLIPSGGGGGGGAGGGGDGSGGPGSGGIGVQSLFSPDPESGKSLFELIKEQGRGVIPAEFFGGETGPTLSQFNSPSAPEDFGFSDAELSQNTDFFNQGGLVSLLPRRATPVRSPPISYRRY